MTIGIIGKGWVGKAMLEVFPNALVHTPAEPNEQAFNADFVFIAVPTPLKDGKLDCSIVQESVDKCSDSSIVILRSTVNPGFCDQQEKRIVMMPEYLGETPSHPLLDETKRNFFDIGGKEDDRRRVIELYQQVYNANVTIRQMSAYEAEIVKVTENRAIAFKMMQCQELYDVCEAAGVDYYAIREAVYGDDPRFNLWWTFVYPDKRGFNNSKCLLKDVPAWCAWAESCGIDPILTQTLINKSNDYALGNHPQ
jgi:UDP-glucose 6-dehydrogenase